MVGTSKLISRLGFHINVFLQWRRNPVTSNTHNPKTYTTEKKNIALLMGRRNTSINTKDLFLNLFHGI